MRTGVEGLDTILDGGFVRNALYLIKGAAGAGKTTLGLQFLLEGVRRGERCLYLGLSESRGQLASLAKSFGWDLEGIRIHDMRRQSDRAQRGKSYTVFNPADVELDEISRELLEQVAEVRPDRLVLDSLSEIRLLSESPYRYRRELLELGDRLTESHCTGFLIDIDAPGPQGVVAETLVSGVLTMEQLSPLYGGARRRIRVLKHRASASIGGYHDMEIGPAGVQVFPRLVAATHRAVHSSAGLRSGVAELDALLGGGIDRGTSTALIGPAGTGKSSIAAQFVAQAAEHGDKGFFLTFDESPANLLHRTDGLGIPLRKQLDAGTVEVVPVDPAEFSPGELAHRVSRAVDAGARLVVIDSLNGYLAAMPEERYLSAHLHELLAFLSEKGVATLLTLSQHGFFGSSESPVNISYVADTVMLFRYFEVAGEVKQAVSVLKKRTGLHERSIRELRLTPEGIRVGEPLLAFQGVLSGHMEFSRSEGVGGSGELVH